MNSKEEISPKKYLEQIEKYNTFIVQKKAEKEEVKKDTKDISGNDYIERIKKLEHLIDEEIVTLAEERHRIINEIQSLSKEKHVHILFERYVKMKSLVEIAAAENYTYEYIKMLHGRALSDFSDNILKKRNKKNQKLSTCF